MSLRWEVEVGVSSQRRTRTVDTAAIVDGSHARHPPDCRILTTYGRQDGRKPRPATRNGRISGHNGRIFVRNGRPATGNGRIFDRNGRPFPVHGRIIWRHGRPFPLAGRIFMRNGRPATRNGRPFPLHGHPLAAKKRQNAASDDQPESPWPPITPLPRPTRHRPDRPPEWRPRSPHRTDRPSQPRLPLPPAAARQPVMGDSPVPRPGRSAFCFDRAVPQCSNQAREPGAPRPHLSRSTDFFGALKC